MKRATLIFLIALTILVAFTIPMGLVLKGGAGMLIEELILVAVGWSLFFLFNRIIKSRAERQ